MPDIFDENSRLWYLLGLASSQWKAGFEGAYILDYGVIIEMAKAMKIEINTLFFEKLRVFEVTCLAGRQERKGASKGE